MKNINEEEGEDTKIMRLRSEEILHTLTVSAIENMKERAAYEGEKRGQQKPILTKRKKYWRKDLRANKALIYLKEKALQKLRNHSIKVKRTKIRDARIRNNRIFQEDQRMFYRKTRGTKQLKGKVLKMEKLEKFWVGMWADNTKTPQRKWLNKVAQKIGQKIRNVQGFMITEKKLYKAVEKRKSWSTLGINRVQSFWCKKLTGT